MEGPRLILDRAGDTLTIPARDFAHSVANHADVRNQSVAESLLIVERLRDLGAIKRNAKVDGQGAVIQSFRGTRAGGNQGCHAMHCQLILDGMFPFQLRAGQEKFNTRFLQRNILLFGRCTWQPKIVNVVDHVLDWNPVVDFRRLYLDSVRTVLDNNKAEDAYRDYAASKARKLDELLEAVRDIPVHDEADIMTFAAALEETSESHSYVVKEVERLLTDQSSMREFQNKRETVVEVYAERDRITPHSVAVGELKNQIQSEQWIGEGDK